MGLHIEVTLGIQSFSSPRIAAQDSLARYLRCDQIQPNNSNDCGWNISCTNVIWIALRLLTRFVRQYCWYHCYCTSPSLLICLNSRKVNLWIQKIRKCSCVTGVEPRPTMINRSMNNQGNEIFFTETPRMVIRVLPRGKEWHSAGDAHQRDNAWGWIAIFVSTFAGVHIHSFRLPYGHSSEYIPRVRCTAFPLSTVSWCVHLCMLIARNGRKVAWSTSRYCQMMCGTQGFNTDPPAGSPTRTLLRLLLPLVVPVHRWATFIFKNFLSNYSQGLPISRSDGRCVQRAGTKPEHDYDAHLLDIPTSRWAIANNDRYFAWDWQV